MMHGCSTFACRQKRWGRSGPPASPRQNIQGLDGLQRVCLPDPKLWCSSLRALPPPKRSPPPPTPPKRSPPSPPPPKRLPAPTLKRPPPPSPRRTSAPSPARASLAAARRLLRWPRPHHQQHPDDPAWRAGGAAVPGGRRGQWRLLLPGHRQPGRLRQVPPSQPALPRREGPALKPDGWTELRCDSTYDGRDWGTVRASTAVPATAAT